MTDGFNKFLAEILDGRHDEQLKALADALGERLNSDTVDGRWCCEVTEGGELESFTIQDLTYRAIRVFEQATKRNINQVDLTGLSGSDTAWLVAAYWASRDTERDGAADRAMQRVELLPGDAIVFDIDIEASPVPLSSAGT